MGGELGWGDDIVILKPKSFPPVCAAPVWVLEATPPMLLGCPLGFESCWLEAQHEVFPWGFVRFGSSCPQGVKSPFYPSFSRGLTSPFEL